MIGSSRIPNRDGVKDQLGPCSDNSLPSASEVSFDYASLRDIGAEGLLHSLAENGIDPSQLDAGQLIDIADDGWAADL